MKRSGGLKMRDWRGEDLAGDWCVTHKLDGVCVIVTDAGETLSRGGNPLHNVPALDPGIYECYLGSWETTVGAVRRMDGAQIPRAAFYSLATLDGVAAPDPRLGAECVSEPAACEIARRLEAAVAAGYEGLVMHSGGKYIKVKPKTTYDVPVIGVQAGTGKHAARMGALVTPRGRVGTGFTDAQRADTYAIGTIIEVECMSLTPAGKFRHPRFVRVRFDK